MTLTSETLVLAVTGLLLVAMLGIGAWLSARMRATTREIQRAVAAARRPPVVAPVVPMTPRQIGPYWDKQQEVYAGLYTRYRRACDNTMPRPGRTPDFSSFSRDELLRYLSRRKVRERDATDAIAALDRGDTFAMTRLMTRLHERVDQRDASIALQRATRYEELQELYLSETVRDAVANLRRCLTPAESAGQHSGERRAPVATPARASDRAIQEALATLQRVMREELSGGQPSAPDSPPARLTAPRDQLVSRDIHTDGVRTVGT
jgi:hypothetical protein